MEKYTVGSWLEKSGFRVLYSKPSRAAGYHMLYRVETREKLRKDQIDQKLVDVVYGVKDAFPYYRVKTSHVKAQTWSPNGGVWRATIRIKLPIRQICMFEL